MKYFKEYMFLGGVDISNASFATSEDALLKTNYIDGTVNDRFYNGQDYWSVDFTGVASTFLSISLPRLAGDDRVKQDLGIGVVENFLRYVLRETACPEYEDDVKKALSVCSSARMELPIVSQFLESLPGIFNLAAAELFCPLDDKRLSFLTFDRPPTFDPKTTFYSSLILSGIKGFLATALSEDLRVVERVYRNIEIVRLERASVEQAQTAARFVCGNSMTPRPQAVALGTIFAKEVVIEDGWYDPTQQRLSQDLLAIVCDDVLLHLLKEGMKLRVRLCLLSSGIYFIKSVQGLYPTFYVFLPQHLVHLVDLPRPFGKSKLSECIEGDIDSAEE